MLLYSVAITLLYLTIVASAKNLRKCADNKLRLTFHEDYANFYQARDVCRNAGGTLVKAHDRPVMDAIKSVSLNGFYFIGLQLQYGSKWIWRDGTQIEQKDGYWHPSQPNGHAEYCVVANLGSGEGRWYDIGCSSRNKYICQKNFQQPLTVSIPGNTFLVTKNYGNVIECKIQSCEDAIVYWYRNSIGGKVANGANLHLNSTIEAADTYHCRANGCCQSNQSSIKVEVDGLPSVTSIECNTCRSKITVEWMASEYAIGFSHRIVAVNHFNGSYHRTLWSGIINSQNQTNTFASFNTSVFDSIQIEACISASNCPYVSTWNLSTITLQSVYLESVSLTCRLSWNVNHASWDPITGYKISVTSENLSSRKPRVNFTKTTQIYVNKTSFDFEPFPNRNHTAMIELMSCSGERPSVMAVGYCVGKRSAPDIVETPTIQKNNIISFKVPDETKGLISCLLLIVFGESFVDVEEKNFFDYIRKISSDDSEVYVSSAVSAHRFAVRPNVSIVLGKGENSSCNMFDTNHSSAGSNHLGNTISKLVYGQNRRLKSSSVYRASLVAVVPNGDELLFKMNSRLNFTTDEHGMIGEPVTSSSSPNSDPSPRTVTIIVVSVTLAVAILSALIFLIIRMKRQRNISVSNPSTNRSSGEQQKASIPRDDFSNPVFHEDSHRQGFSVRRNNIPDYDGGERAIPENERQYENYAPIVRNPTTFRIADIEEVFNYKRTNGNAGFMEEFQKILIDSAKFQKCRKIASDEKLKSKNRYRNILPYDATRVLLNNSELDYINASYIRGNGEERRYIAAQGPLSRTVNDFWLMIVEQKCQVIVMLTKEKEGGKKKCERYWPDVEKQQTYGSITVQNIQEIDYGAYIIKTLRATSGSEQEGGESMVLTQFLFLKWPDHGVPQTTSNLVRMHRAAIKSYEDSQDGGPMIVHCSAGAGRTGTFIGYDILFQQNKSKPKADVYQCVMELRKQRVDMVQNTDQYTLLYKLILESCVFNDTDYSPEELKEKMEEINSSLEGMYILKREFDDLSKVGPMKRSQDIAKLEGNKDFNRPGNDLPYDYSRVTILMQPDETFAPYVNASWLETLDKDCRMIAAQGPTACSVEIFWRAIVTNEINTVVMLTNLFERREEQCVHYWPAGTGQKLVFTFVTVTLVSEEAYGKIVERQLVIESDRLQEPWVVTQFHFTDWASTSYPSDGNELISLINKMQENVRKSAGTAALIHCSDGTGRTGAFCALVNLIDRLKCENRIDVFRTVKDLRDARPNMVKNLDQYKFCYQAILYYLSTFELYANF